MLKQLALLFGLPETATEEEVLSAAQAYKDKMDAAAMTAEAETAAAANSARIADKAAFVKAYCINKEAALAALNSAKAPAAVNRADARAPSFKVSDAGKAMNRDEFKRELARQPPGKRQAWHDEHVGSVAD